MNNELETRQGTYVTFFLREMNLISHKIGMQGSNFANPHGLNNPQNYSCA
jgi:D-alanyl-D-alanine carboxypeptidase